MFSELLKYNLGAGVEACSTRRESELPYPVIQGHQVHKAKVAFIEQPGMTREELEGYDVFVTTLRDGILNVEVLSKKAKVPASFNAEEFFADHYGIIVGTDNPLCTVELRVVANQVKYFDSLPLHWTQKKVEETPEYTIYSYHLIPSFDFRQEILGRGAAVKVLTPDWFRDEIACEVKEMVKNYD